jgi:hypothetical protein
MAGKDNPAGRTSRMLELYHHGSSVCAAKVRLALDEKKLAWTGYYLHEAQPKSRCPDAGA